MSTEPRPLAMQIVLDGSPSGGSTVVLGTCRDLRRLGWLTLIVCPADSYLLHAARAEGLQTHAVSFGKHRLSLQALAQTRRLLDQHRPALVHMHGARAALPAVLLSLLMRTPPLVYSIHGFHFPFKPWMTRRLGAMTEALISARSAGVVYVSNDDLTLARRWDLMPREEDRTTLICNGVDPLELEDARQLGHAKQQDLVFLGRLVPQKNPMLFLRIVQGLDRSVTAAVVGGGALEERLRRWVDREGLGARVRFYGALPRREALGVLAQSRLCVFPSRWEGLPIAPIEASYMGVPVVASNIPGTREVVHHGKNGYLVEGSEAAPYVDKIRSVLADPDLLRSLGHAGRQIVRDHFDRQNSSAAYAALYARLADKATSDARTEKSFALSELP